MLEGLLRRRAAELRAVDAHALAERLLGDAIAANVLLLGMAWQAGLVPVGLSALERAIELNGVAVPANRLAFAWGRLAAADPAFVAEHAADPSVTPPARDLSEVVTRRAAFLAAYQDEAYAERYRRRVEMVRRAEAALGGTRLTEAVARNLFKLMAYKDEYEVARLHAATGFTEGLLARFEGRPRLRFHLAPPLLARPGPDGEPRKIAFGPWILPAFRLMARLRRLRGTILDPFGHTAERRHERQMIADYEAMLEAEVPGLTAERLPVLVELASLPATVRGFGHVKGRAAAAAAARRTALLAQLPPRGACAATTQRLAMPQRAKAKLSA
jgi:indolepyruvate ferredoxin oxidoreductase